MSNGHHANLLVVLGILSKRGRDEYLFKWPYPPPSVRLHVRTAAHAPKAHSRVFRSIGQCAEESIPVYRKAKDT